MFGTKSNLSIDFFKIDGNGRCLKIFARKGGGWVRQNREGMSRNGVGGDLPYYIEVFLEIPHDAA